MSGVDTAKLYKSAEGHAAMMAWYDAMLARVPVPLESLFVPTRYGETHVLASGPQEAPPLLLVSGLGGNALLWRRQLADFSDDFRVYAVDVVGQTGRSVPTHPSHNGPAYAHWLLDVLDGLVVERADVIGASLGARLVIKLGAHPQGAERIRRVVLLSAIGLAPLNMGLFVRLLPIGFNLRRSSHDTFMALLRSVLAVADGPPDDDLEMMLEGFCLFGMHVRQEAAAGLPMVFPLRAKELRAFAPPVLLLMGEAERLFNPQRVIARARRYFALLVAAELVPGMGHNLIVQHNPQVDARMLSFLQAPETG